MLFYLFINIKEKEEKQNWETKRKIYNEMKKLIEVELDNLKNHEEAYDQEI